MIVSCTSLCYPDFYSQFHFVQRGARAVEVCPGVASLVGGEPAVPTHVGLSAQPQGDQSAAGGAHASPDTRDNIIFGVFSVICSQLDVLGGEHVVQVHVQLGAALLEPPLLGGLVRDEVMVEAAPLVHLEHEAALLVHGGLVGQVGDPRHVAHAAPVISIAQPPPAQRPA